jgi:hypothetical protein
VTPEIEAKNGKVQNNVQWKYGMSSEPMAVDLGKSASELGRALNSVREMRGQWNEILRESIQCLVLKLVFLYPLLLNREQ